VPREFLNNAYELIESNEISDRVYEQVLRPFAEAHNWDYQIGFNGRSGGYMVLYRGYRKPSGYKSRCQDCFQKNYKTVEESGDNICGKCGANARVNCTMFDIGTWPGKGIDDEELLDVDLYSLRERVKLVQEFDTAVQKAAEIFLDFCKGCHMEEETIQVEQKIKVLKCNTPAAVPETITQ
jgi:hypothetical protein